MKDIIEIMARAMWKLDPLDETGEIKWRYYSPEAQAAAKALKASGYAIVPVEPSDKTLRDMAKAIALVSIKTAESEYASGQKLSEKGIEGLVEYFWMKCLPDASAAYRAAIKAGDKS